MVAGLYQPLADGDTPIARHVTRPNLSPAVVSEDKEQRALANPLFFGLEQNRRTETEPLQLPNSQTTKGHSPPLVPPA
jgi:hypothetical protein